MKFQSLPILASLLFVLGTPTQAWDPPDGDPGKLGVYTEKTIYKRSESVQFMLYHHPGLDTSPANLSESIYFIEKRREDGSWREFFTSRKEPAGASLPPGIKKGWTWDLLDNERKHKAKQGNWRLRFAVPHDRDSELIVRFRIVDDE